MRTVRLRDGPAMAPIRRFVSDDSVALLTELCRADE